MSFGTSTEIVRAKMLHNYLEECSRKELREMRKKKKSPLQFVWIGKKLRMLFTSINTIL
jgi:hypothetical protein